MRNASLAWKWWALCQWAHHLTERARARAWERAARLEVEP